MTDSKKICGRHWVSILVIALLLITTSPFSLSLADDDDDFLKALEAANNGDAEAQVELGTFYRQGRGTLINLEKAFTWYDKAADSGNARGKALLGELYAHGEGCKKDLAKALALYQEAADAGDGLGINNVAHANINGLDGGEPDYEKALPMLRKAADMGIADAYSNLGGLYIQGKGVEQDLDQGRLYVTKSTELGSTSSMIFMATIHLRGLGVPADAAKAEGWLRKAIDVGSADAMLQLAGLYARDESKRSEAFALVRKAAGKGSLKGQTELGNAYLNGIGTEKDPVKARQFFSDAADRGSSNAMFIMAKLLQSGTGGIQDQESSVAMLKKAANAGHPVACRSMGEAYFSGQLFGKRDMDEAVNWFRKAAQGNDIQSQVGLANILTQHIGKNIGEEGNDKKVYEAFKWAEAAANRGDLNGMKMAAAIAPLVATFRVSEAFDNHKDEEEDNYVTLDNGQKIYFEPISPAFGIREHYDAIAEKWRTKAASAGDPEAAYMMAFEQYQTISNDYLFTTGLSGGRKSASDLSADFREEALKAVSAAEGALKPMMDLEKIPPQGLVLKGQLLEARMLLMERSEARTKVAQEVYDTLFKAADQGSPEGMAELARTLERRFGKPESAYKWRTKAGEAGHGDSLVWLGRYHYEKEEWPDAKEWLTKAKAKGESVDGLLKRTEEKEKSGATAKHENTDSEEKESGSRSDEDHAKKVGTPREIGETVRESVIAFVAGHRRTIAGDDPELWAGRFAEGAKYCYLEGPASRELLIEDRKKLLQRYDRRSYTFGDPSYRAYDGGSKIELTFPYSFEYKAPGKAVRQGSTVETLHLKWVKDRWLIVDYSEEVAN